LWVVSTKSCGKTATQETDVQRRGTEGETKVKMDSFDTLPLIKWGGRENDEYRRLGGRRGTGIYRRDTGGGNGGSHTSLCVTRWEKMETGKG